MQHAMLPSALPAYFIILLWFGSANAFSLPSAAPGETIFCQHRLVEHTDQLRQRRYDHDEHDERSLIPPPHLFCIPAPGGDICLVVDEKGAYHAVRDSCPPLGVPLSQTAVVDSQVNAIGDTLFGTRFHLKDGTVRGPWCPGGGTAGPLLLQLARHRRYPRLARFLLALSQRTAGRRSWREAHHLPPSPPRRRRRRKWTSFFFFRRPTSFDPDKKKSATALEVLAVTEQTDGSLAVALPLSSTAAGKEDGGAPWVAKCGLAGYEY